MSCQEGLCGEASPTENRAPTVNPVAIHFTGRPFSVILSKYKLLKTTMEILQSYRSAQIFPYTLFGSWLLFQCL